MSVEGVALVVVEVVVVDVVMVVDVVGVVIGLMLVVVVVGRVGREEEGPSIWTHIAASSSLLLVETIMASSSVLPR